jgi:hypothetical protein
VLAKPRNRITRGALVAALPLLAATPAVWARAGKSTAPTVTIESPVTGASYTEGESVAAAYSCAASAPAKLSSCSGPVASGAPIPTNTAGEHTFTVAARDSDGGTAARTVVYIVAAGPARAEPVASAPVLSELAESTAVWREGGRPVQISRAKLPLGTTFSFSLNEQAAVTFSFMQSGRCQADTGVRGLGRNCTRGALLGTFSFPAHGGANRVLFQGQLPRSKRLRAGRYTVVVSATNIAGAHGAPQTLAFTIVG